MRWCESGLRLIARKRPGYSSNTPGSNLVQVWAPLLEHLAELQVPISSILVDNLVNILEDSSQPPLGEESDIAEVRRENESTKWCLATWLLWLWEQEGPLRLTEEEKTATAKRILEALLKGDPWYVCTLSQ